MFLVDTGWMPAVNHMLLEPLLPRKAFHYWHSTLSGWWHLLFFLVVVLCFVVFFVCLFISFFFIVTFYLFSVFCFAPTGVSLCRAHVSGPPILNSNDRKKKAKMTCPLTLQCVLRDLFLWWNFCSVYGRSCKQGYNPGKRLCSFLFSVVAFPLPILVNMPAR